MTQLKVSPQIQRYIGKLVGEYEMTQFNEQVAKARLRLEEEKKAKQITSLGWSRDLQDETLVHEFTNFANGTSVVRTTRIVDGKR
tara:strand:- start:764 stop:1018 length:255 start_codon:yes stop_codon:yes gene_type:complete